MTTSRVSRLLIAVLLISGLFPITTLSAYAEAPSNDNVEDATVIAQLPFEATVDATDATKQDPEFGGCSGGNHSVWYSFTAPAAMRIAVWMGGGYDLLSGVLRSDGGTIHCQEEAAEPRVDLDQGQTIYFRLAHHPGLRRIEPWTLRVREVVQPTNDSIGNAAVADSHRFTMKADFDFASAGSEDPRCGPVGARTVWYRYTAGKDRLIRASATPDVFSSPELNPNAHISAYTRHAGSLSQLGCARSSTYLPASLGLSVERGEEVFFAMAVASGVDEASGQFSLRGGRVPPNDDFDLAEVIPLLPLDDDGLPPSFAHPDPFWATSAVDDPADSDRCPVVPTQTIWYTYTAPEPMSVSFLSSSGAGPNRLLAYQGSRGNLTTIACDEQLAGGKITVNLAQDQTVHLLAWCCESLSRMSLHAYAVPRGPARNDTQRTAVDIPQVKRWTWFTRTKDASAATSQPSDPKCLDSRRTLWYSYTPTKTMRVEATTAASNYDTTLGVFRKRDLSKLACVNDNRPADTLHVGQWEGSGHVAERVTFRAVEGKTYLMMVGALDRPSIVRFALSKAG